MNFEEERKSILFQKFLMFGHVSIFLFSADFQHQFPQVAVISGCQAT